MSHLFVSYDLEQDDLKLVRAKVPELSKSRLLSSKQCIDNLVHTSSSRSRMCSCMHYFCLISCLVSFMNHFADCSGKYDGYTSRHTTSHKASIIRIHDEQTHLTDQLIY